MSINVTLEERMEKLKAIAKDFVEKNKNEISAEEVSYIVNIFENDLKFLKNHQSFKEETPCGFGSSENCECGIDKRIREQILENDELLRKRGSTRDCRKD